MCLKTLIPAFSHPISLFLMKMKRTVILHLCILLSLLLVVRCDDDDEEEEFDVKDDNIPNYGEYEPPTKTYDTDPKIISRNVKCLGKTIEIIR